MLNCIFISAKRLKSKNGNEFCLATFALNGDVFKCVIDDNIFSLVRDFQSGSKVSLDYELSVWSEKLQVKVVSVQPFDDIH